MLDRRTFVIRERVAFARLSDTYDILDAESGAVVAVAEERLPPAVRALRLLLGKRLLPTTVVIAEHEGGTPVLTLSRGPTFLRAHVRLTDERGALLGTFVSKWFSFAGGFVVHDAAGAEAGRVNGDLVGWNFEFMTGGRRAGRVTKKWAGIGKELFTNADTYVVAVEDPKATPRLTGFVLAAGIAIDTVFKERQK